MKVYLSRSQSRAIAADYPVGDPSGGAAYGEFNDPMTVMGGASIVGGLMQADAAGDAADAQAQAAARSDATQRYMYDTTREDNKPFRDAGVAANNRLAYLLGLGTAGGPGTSQQLTADQFRNQLLPQFTSTSAPAAPQINPSLAAFYASTDGRSSPVNQAAPTTAIDEAGLSAAIQQRMDEQARQAAAQQASAQNDPQYGSLLRNFSAADLNADPVYQSGLQFGLNEGTKGINRMAAAGGSMLSGATLKALTKYGNDYGSTKANESFNRFNTNQDRTYNKLAGLSGAGQQATNQVSAAGQNMANNISQSQQGVGNARASGYIGQANAVTGGLSQGYNMYQNNRLMDALTANGNQQSAMNYANPWTTQGADLNAFNGYGSNIVGL